MLSIQKNKRFTKAIRQGQIIAVMIHFGADGLTMSGIAWWLGMVPSSHLMSILKSMEDMKMIKRSEKMHRKNAKVFWWEIADAGEQVYDWMSLTGQWGTK